MGIFSKILGAADPATGKKRRSADPRMKGVGRGPTTRATRGKVPPGRTPSARGMTWGRGKAPAQPPPSGLGKLLGSLTGRR
jgi:hypothetical protein